MSQLFAVKLSTALDFLRLLAGAWFLQLAGDAFSFLDDGPAQQQPVGAFSSLDDGSAQQRPGFGCFMDGEWLAARGLFCCL